MLAETRSLNRDGAVARRRQTMFVRLKENVVFFKFMVGLR